jgi:hypothetical protein
MPHARTPGHDAGTTDAWRGGSDRDRACDVRRGPRLPRVARDVLARAAVGIGAVATVGGVDETEGRSGGRSGRWRSPRPAELGRLTAWGRALRATAFEVWGRDVLEHRDYLWLLASRLAILMATGTLQPFVYYLLEDSLGMGSAALVAVAPLAG